MLIIKKTTFRTLVFFSLLTMTILLGLLFSPALRPVAANSNCVDNGVADPGEGCDCKDVVCEDESPASACGTPA